MAEKIELKLMRCPTCGAKLKVERPNEPLLCLHCENTIVPIIGASSPAPEKTSAAMLTSVRIEGIKTSASALAYLEQFFEEFDWEAFVFSQNLIIPDIKKMVESLKVTSADDKNTWLACFEALYVPIIKKAEGCSNLLSQVIEEYISDDFDAYSKFDAYKRISGAIRDTAEDTLATLTKYLSYAKKYGASEAEAEDLVKKTENFRMRSNITVYSSIDEIPRIRTLLQEKDQKLIEKLAQKGINAPELYANAKKQIEAKNYVGALSLLNQLEGYSDSSKLAEEIDRYFLIEDILEVKGELYFFKRNPELNNHLELFPTTNGIINHTPIIKDIGQIITNYANILYFLDTSNHIKRYDLNTATLSKADNRIFNKSHIFAYKENSIMLLARSQNGTQELVELNPATGGMQTVISGIRKIISTDESYIVYSENIATQNLEDNSGCFSFKSSPAPAPSAPVTVDTNIFDLSTKQVTKLGRGALKVEGYVNGYVVYTRPAPNELNNNLYIRKLNDPSAPDILLETNIFSFLSIVSDKLFYYIGNNRNKTLISINPNGTGRQELPSFISEILFEQNGWLYFIRRSGYNTALCKAKTNMTEVSLITDDIERFVALKNGYLYYVNDVNSLIKIRMDGTNFTELCTQVESVLSVKENRIVFVSVDDTIKEGGLTPVFTKVKSIYAVDFDGTGKKKLTYNIKTAKSYNEEYIYYISSKRIRPNVNAQPGASATEAPSSVDSLFSLNIITGATKKLLEVTQAQKEKENNTNIIIAIAIAVILLFFGIVCLAIGAAGMFIVGLLLALIPLGYIFYIKVVKKE